MQRRSARRGYLLRLSPEHRDLPMFSGMGDRDEIEICGQRIREKRKILGLTQEQLAHEVGVQQSSISDVETGSGTVGRETLARIATVLGESVDTLMGLDGMPNELRDFENTILEAIPKRLKRKLEHLMREDPGAVEDAAAVFAAALERAAERLESKREEPTKNR